MFLNLSEFKDIGFFDENFFFYFEEIDLCKRLINQGKKIYLVPDIIIHHEGAASHDRIYKKGNGIIKKLALDVVNFLLS